MTSTLYDITCVVRLLNVELFENHCLPRLHPKWTIRAYSGTESSWYLPIIFSDQAITSDWIINCDEDCFLTNTDAIHHLIDIMVAHNWDFCGVRDGGGLGIRSESKDITNTFFNIFNLKRIRERYKYGSFVNWDPHRFLSGIDPNTLKFPEVLAKAWRGDFYQEPYSQSLYWLLANNYRFLPLTAIEGFPGRYTRVPHHGPSFFYSPSGDCLGVHAWFARTYKNPNAKYGHYYRSLNDFGQPRFDDIFTYLATLPPIPWTRPAYTHIHTNGRRPISSKMVP